MRKFSLLFFALVSVCTQAFGGNPSPAAGSFANVAQNCVAVDLSTWKHPTRQVLVAGKLRIQKAQICNGGKYPVFYVQSEFDPRSTQVRPYYLSLYGRVLRSNGLWPYSIVFQPDGLVVNVTANKANNAEGIHVIEEDINTQE